MFNYKSDEFRKLIKESISYAEVLKKLNIVISGGNYKTLKKHIKIENIDISHFLGQGYLKGKTHNWSPKISLEDILIQDSHYSNGVLLKKRLLKEGLLIYKCSDCGLTDWNNKPIALELHHINGDHFDNRIENLTILCPNCHSQTKSFRVKNTNPSIVCLNCGKIVLNKRKKFCSPECSKTYLSNESLEKIKFQKHITVPSNKPAVFSPKPVKDPNWRNAPKPNRRKVIRPDKQELEKLILENSFCKLSRMFGVSDNAIRKWAISAGIEKDIIRKRKKSFFP